MDPKKFISPKEIEIANKRFIISKIPAIQAQQIYRSIMQECKDDGDIGMTYLSADTVQELLSYSAIVDAGEGADNWTSLEGANQINFATENVETLIKLEAAMIRYNFSFLFDGTLQEVLGVLRDISPAT